MGTLLKYCAYKEFSLEINLNTSWPPKMKKNFIDFIDRSRREIEQYLMFGLDFIFHFEFECLLLQTHKKTCLTKKKTFLCIYFFRILENSIPHFLWKRDIAKIDQVSTSFFFQDKVKTKIFNSIELAICSSIFPDLPPKKTGKFFGILLRPFSFRIKAFVRSASLRPL